MASRIGLAILILLSTTCIPINGQEVTLCSNTNTSINPYTNSTISDTLEPYYDAGITLIHVISGNKEINIDHIRLLIDYFQNSTQLTFNDAFNVVEPILSDHIGFTTILVIGLIYAILFPLIGLIFCICRLCGKCGAEKYQKRVSNCSCISMTVFIILSVCFFTTATVLYGLANHRLYKELENVPSDLTDQMEYASDFVHHSSFTMKCSLTKAYQTEFKEIDAIRFDIGEEFVNVILNVSGMEKLENLESAVEMFNGIVKEMENKTKELCGQSQVLNSNMSIFTMVFSNSSLGKEYGKMDANEIGKELSVYCALTGKIPDLQNITNFTQLIQPNIDILNSEAEKVQQKANIVFKDLEKTNSSIELAISHIDKTSGDIITAIDRVHDKANFSFAQPIESFTNKYSWLEYVGLIFVLPTALVILCFLLGLIFGLCDYRNKKAPYERSGASDCGGSTLMAGTGLIFLFSWLIMLITLALFIVGYVGETQVCTAFFQDQNSSILQLIPNIEVDSDSGFELNVGNVVEGCKRNDPILHLLNLESKIDLQTELNQINAKLDYFEKQFNITDYFDVKKIAFIPTENSVSNILRQLNETLEPLDMASNLTGPILAKNELEKMQNFLKNKSGQEAEFLMEQVDNLLENLSNFEMEIDSFKNLAFSASNSSEKIQHIIRWDIPNPNETIGWVQSAIMKKSDSLKEIVKTGFKNLIGKVNSTVLTSGRCRPLYDIYTNIGSLFCRRVLYPLHGIWLSLIFFLIFSIPAVIYAIKLSKYFRRMDESFYRTSIGDTARWSTNSNTMEMRCPKPC